jgi:hypothetical protein
MQYLCINCVQPHESHWADPGGNVGPFCARCYHLIAAPLPASAALPALIAKWRGLVEEVRAHPASDATNQYYGNGLAWAYHQCADELEAALPRADQP